MAKPTQDEIGAMREVDKLIGLMSELLTENGYQPGKMPTDELCASLKVNIATCLAFLDGLLTLRREIMAGRLQAVQISRELFLS